DACLEQQQSGRYSNPVHVGAAPASADNTAPRSAPLISATALWQIAAFVLMYSLILLSIYYFVESLYPPSDWLLCTSVALYAGIATSSGIFLYCFCTMLIHDPLWTALCIPAPVLLPYVVYRNHTEPKAWLLLILPPLQVGVGYYLLSAISEQDPTRDFFYEI